MARLVEKGLSELEYDTMLSALTGTSKGRAFLAEYVHRSRPSEIRSLLSAMSQLAGTIAALKADIRPGRLAGELTRIATQMPNGPEKQELLVLAASMQEGPDSDLPMESPERLLAQIAPLRSLTEEPHAPGPASAAPAGNGAAQAAAPDEEESAPDEADVFEDDRKFQEDDDRDRFTP
ncbi:hypothetical protein [Afifella sp. IM 167]|uniref:hypothetical protein n=1 Tax=Afifella sp. IM 167 TaxID=2033586 RepID=UPI001CCCB207|nr:hypothetical protein [Afifella sp. IM 167]MBZ8135301.1 hypothetical protein [Afifella sp. IM 167]